MKQVQWELGHVGGDVNVCIRKWVQACLTAGGRMFPPLGLMSTPLESATLPLENSALETLQPPPACASLEVVLSGVYEICACFYGFQFLGWHYECEFSGGWAAVALCSIGKGCPTTIDGVYPFSITTK